MYNSDVQWCKELAGRVFRITGFVTCEQYSVYPEGKPDFAPNEANLKSADNQLFNNLIDEFYGRTIHMEQY